MLYNSNQEYKKNIQELEQTNKALQEDFKIKVEQFLSDYEQLRKQNSDLIQMFIH